jgi:hypothetical protein
MPRNYELYNVRLSSPDIDKTAASSSATDILPKKYEFVQHIQNI